MRWIFVLFLSINVIYFGWELDRQIKLDRQNIPQNTSQISAAEQLKLLSEIDAVSLVNQGESEHPGSVPGDFSNTNSLFVSSGDSQLVTELPEISGINLDSGAAVNYCYTFGPIEEEVLAVGIGDWFNSRRAKASIHFTDETGSQLFWIYLAPEDTGHDAMDFIRDLQDKGIEDYRLIKKGNLLNAISLGLYSGQAALNERIGKLKEQGYKPVVVPYSEGKRLYWVDVKLSVDPGTLAGIFKGYPSRYNYVPVDCNKIAMQPASP